MLQDLREAEPELDWDTKEENWEEVERSRLEVRRRVLREETSFSMLMAKIVPAFKLPPILGRTYTVRDLYKYVPGGGKETDMVYFNGETWILDSGKHATKSFNKIVAKALAAAIGVWEGDLPVICENAAFMNSVTDQLQAGLFKSCCLNNIGNKRTHVRKNNGKADLFDIDFFLS